MVPTLYKEAKKLRWRGANKILKLKKSRVGYINEKKKQRYKYKI